MATGLLAWGVNLKNPAPPSTKTSIPQRLLTAAEAAQYLGYRTPWPVRELMWKGALPVVRLGKRRIAFDLQDLDRFIEENKTCEAA